jgi:hypothetical protein
MGYKKIPLTFGDHEVEWTCKLKCLQILVLDVNKHVCKLWFLEGYYAIKYSEFLVVFIIK